MKRTLIALVAIAAMVAVSCATVNTRAPGGSAGGGAASAERKVSGGLPQEVRDIIKNCPEDALIGIGTSNHSNFSLKRTAAQTRARADISRQLESIIKDMITDYTAGSEGDPSAVLQFTENITTALSKSKLVGVKVVEEVEDAKGNYWVVTMLSKSTTADEINQAQAAAKLAVPAMAAFSAADRMDKAFEKALGEPVSYVDN